jgi:hypothetical protein
MALKTDLNVNDAIDMAAELLASKTRAEYERGVLETLGWLTGLTDDADHSYLAVRLHLDLDRLYPSNGEPHISTWIGDDGAHVVQVDTVEDTGHVRVNVNDGTVFDADPEIDPGVGLRPDTSP